MLTPCGLLFKIILRGEEGEGINAVGKSYHDILRHTLSIFAWPNTRASTMGGEGEITYRSEQYGAPVRVPARGYCVIIINAYITTQQSDRLIGAADDDFDLIHARRARHYALRHNGEPARIRLRRIINVIAPNAA